MAIIGKPFFVIPAELESIVCDSADTGHPVSNLAQERAIGVTWKSGPTGNHWARGIFTGSQTIDFCGIIAANASSGTHVRLRLGASQSEVDGASAAYDSTALPFIPVTPAAAPLDELYHSHLELVTPVAATWWRIDITGHTGAFEASTLVLGRRITPSRFYDLDYEQGTQDLGELKVGNWGVLDENDGLVFRTLDFTLAWQNEVEFETTFRPMMQRLGQRGIVYCCFDPTESSYRHARTYMGYLRKPLFARGVKKPRTFSQEYSLFSMI